MLVGIIIVIVAFVGWGIYGYTKGAPHGLGAEGFKAAMTGVVGMRKLNRQIADKQARERAAGNE